MADRSEYIECYKHFVEVVLVRNMTDDLVKSLKHDGCDDIEKLGMMDSSSVGRLKLINNSGAEVPLNNSDKQLLRVVLLFFTLEDKADVYNHATFMALTAKDWQDFNSALRRAYPNTGASGSSSATDGGILAATTDDGVKTPVCSKSNGGTAPPATLSTAPRTMESFKNGHKHSVGKVIPKERSKCTVATPAKRDKAVHRKEPVDREQFKLSVTHGVSFKSESFLVDRGAHDIQDRISDGNSDRSETETEATPWTIVGQVDASTNEGCMATTTTASTVDFVTAASMLGKDVPFGTYVKAIALPHIVPTTDARCDPSMLAISTFNAPAGALILPSTIVEQATSLSTAETIVLTSADPTAKPVATGNVDVPIVNVGAYTEPTSNSAPHLVTLSDTLALLPMGTYLSALHFRQRNFQQSDSYDTDISDDPISTAVFDSYETDINDDSIPPDDITRETTDEATAELLNNGEPIVVNKKDPNFTLLRPLFAWLGTDIVQKTFERTTQYGRLPMGTRLRQMFRSANPALDVPRRNESVASDFVFSDVPAVDGSETTAVLFVGVDSNVVDTRQFADFVPEQGPGGGDLGVDVPARGALLVLAPAFGQEPLTGRNFLLEIHDIDPEPPPFASYLRAKEILNAHQPNAGTTPSTNNDTTPSATIDYTKPNCIVTTDLENGEIPIGVNVDDDDNLTGAADVHEHSQYDSTVVADDDPVVTVTVCINNTHFADDNHAGRQWRAMDPMIFLLAHSICDTTPEMRNGEMVKRHHLSDGHLWNDTKSFVVTDGVNTYDHVGLMQITNQEWSKFLRTRAESTTTTSISANRPASSSAMATVKDDHILREESPTSSTEQQFNGTTMHGLNTSNVKTDECNQSQSSKSSSMLSVCSDIKYDTQMESPNRPTFLDVAMDCIQLSTSAAGDVGVSHPYGIGGSNVERCSQPQWRDDDDMTTMTGRISDLHLLDQDNNVDCLANADVVDHNQRDITVVADDDPDGFIKVLATDTVSKSTDSLDHLSYGRGAIDSVDTLDHLGQERGANDRAYEWGARGLYGDDDNTTNPTLALPSEMHIGGGSDYDNPNDSTFAMTDLRSYGDGSIHVLYLQTDSVGGEINNVDHGHDVEPEPPDTSTDGNHSNVDAVNISMGSDNTAFTPIINLDFPAEHPCATHPDYRTFIRATTPVTKNGEIVKGHCLIGGPLWDGSNSPGTCDCNVNQCESTMAAEVDEHNHLDLTVVADDDPVSTVTNCVNTPHDPPPSKLIWMLKATHDGRFKGDMTANNNGSKAEPVWTRASSQRIGEWKTDSATDRYVLRWYPFKTRTLLRQSGPALKAIREGTYCPVITHVGWYPLEDTSLLHLDLVGMSMRQNASNWSMPLHTWLEETPRMRPIRCINVGGTFGT